MNDRAERNIANQLAALTGRFLADLPERIETIRRLHAALDDPDTALEHLITLHRSTHGLTGAAGTFGIPLVGQAAQQVELAAKGMLDRGTPPDAAEREQLAALIHTLAQRVDTASGEAPAPPPVAAISAPSERSVYLVEDDPALAEAIATTLTGGGYRVTILDSPDALTSACDEAVPAAILMDMVFHQGEIAGAEAIADLRAHLGALPPVAFISARNDTESRLAAARAGAVRYFTKPLDLPRLTATLAELTGEASAAPYRVLVVDDAETLAAYYKTVLGNAGMEVRVITNPLESLDALASFDPELLVLDMHMPDCSGLEVAAMVRQDDSLSHMPIVFLSGEEDPDKQMGAMNLGGDDFLTKPVEANHLVQALTARLRRARHIRLLNTELAAVRADVERSRDDLLAILNGLHSGTVLTDGEGRITFASDAARRLCPTLNAKERSPWEACVPFSEADRERIRHMADQPQGERTRVPVRCRENGREVRLEVDVRDDPRDPRGKLFVLYDVTEVADLRDMLDERSRYHGMVGRSHAMQTVFSQIGDVAAVDWTVLIEGQTGTGKELVARAIHEQSHRAGKPFVAVNCAGLTDSVLTSQLFGHKRGAFTGAVSDHKGFFEAADGGTIFLDEIGDIPPTVQTNLLRVLQEREILRLGESHPRKVDVRVLAATHRNLAEEAEAGRFRADLLYRIRVARITLPPLKDRNEDIPLMATHFLNRSRTLSGKPVDTIGQDAMRLLLGYPWPGNVRELEHAIEFAVIRCRGRMIQPDDLPPEIADRARQTDIAPPAGRREQLLAAIEEAEGNRAMAARKLGISRATLYRRLEEHGIAPKS